MNHRLQRRQDKDHRITTLELTIELMAAHIAALRAENDALSQEREFYRQIAPAAYIGRTA